VLVAAFDRPGVVECPRPKGPPLDAQRTGNLLLDALAADERDRLLEGVKPHPIALGEVWLAPGDPIETVAFPISGTMSLIAETGGSLVEAASVGREGVVDAFASIASRVAAQRIIGQIDGDMIEVPVERFARVYEDSATIRRLIHGYIEALFVHTSVSAACLAVHHLNERCARWLLQTHDRVDSDTFHLKQEFLALMLGVHRPSVSIAAKTLQAAGLITYRRGNVTIVDRQGLERTSCACYETIRTAYSRLVPLS
jgi:CRP-like cAMP-binding protein